MKVVLKISSFIWLLLFLTDAKLALSRVIHENCIHMPKYDPMLRERCTKLYVTVSLEVAGPDNTQPKPLVTLSTKTFPGVDHSNHIVSVRTVEASNSKGTKISDRNPTKSTPTAITGVKYSSVSKTHAVFSKTTLNKVSPRPQATIVSSQTSTTQPTTTAATATTIKTMKTIVDDDKLFKEYTRLTKNTTKGKIGDKEIHNSASSRILEYRDNLLCVLSTLLILCKIVH